MTGTAEPSAASPSPSSEPSIAVVSPRTTPSTSTRYPWSPTHQATMGVRSSTEMETRSGTVPGAVLIPLNELGRRMNTLPRDRKILTICRSSHRSPIAARQLKRAGYDVVNVLGGTIGWYRAGLPMVKPDDGGAGAG
ncbi:rhodanese-like domain-containing protein [Cytophagia bacterium CHB2]|nr:rhodanese-like domain-containing protein [Cytophagia bacterium CHB2]